MVSRECGRLVLGGILHPDDFLDAIAPPKYRRHRELKMTPLVRIDARIDGPVSCHELPSQDETVLHHRDP